MFMAPFSSDLKLIKKESQKNKKKKKTYEMFSAEMKAQFQPKLLSNMRAEHFMRTVLCSRKYFIYSNH